MTDLVFVYGTLKAGHGNNELLKGSEFVGEHVTKPIYTMKNLGGFPGVLLDGNTSIIGEVYRVTSPTMARLDRLEGYPHFYNRTKILTDHGEAWMYYLDANKYASHSDILSGKW